MNCFCKQNNGKKSHGKFYNIKSEKPPTAPTNLRCKVLPQNWTQRSQVFMWCVSKSQKYSSELIGLNWDLIWNRTCTTNKTKTEFSKSVSIQAFGLSDNFYEGLNFKQWPIPWFQWSGYVIDDSIPILLHAFNEHGLNCT